ncbi:hypothetical protein NCER_101618 [Vairimorpha ceranae BRL01]|uniref:Uncharacterized protein n=2 Tax=Vairimorpha ceranae TaxID=40302 RepID=C4VAF1_VAIC1|nr:hypothetical protein NCER_101618 [Vairimorpha ceranae BRL01]
MFYKLYIVYCIFVLLIILIIFKVLKGQGQKQNTESEILTTSSEKNEKTKNSVEIHSLYNNLVEKYSQLKSINVPDFVLIIYSLRYIAFIPEEDLILFFESVAYYISCSKNQLIGTLENIQREFYDDKKIIKCFLTRVKCIKNDFFSGSKNPVGFFDQHLRFLFKYKIHKFKIFCNKDFIKSFYTFHGYLNMFPHIAQIFSEDKEMQKIFEKKYITNLKNCKCSIFDYVFLLMWIESLPYVNSSN